MKKVEELVFIFAGNRGQAEDFVRQFTNLKPEHWTYVSHASTLVGLHDFLIIQVGTWYQRQDKLPILELMRAANARFIKCYH